jgi:hypothetical protein
MRDQAIEIELDPIQTDGVAADTVATGSPQVLRLVRSLKFRISGLLV